MIRSGELDKEKQGMSNIEKAFVVVSWLISLYFFIVFHTSAGFPPKSPISSSSWVLLGMSGIFFVLPFVSRLRIGNAIEFERKVREVENQVKEFKEETRNSLALISNAVTTISNISNTFTVSLPGVAELTAAKEGVQAVEQHESISSDARRIKEELLFLDDESTILPLARVRIRIEQLLRQILQKRLKTSNLRDREIKFLSARRLFQRFLEEYPQYQSLAPAFDYVIRVCNAAVHGQKVPFDEAEEALNMGAEIIALLSKIAEKPNNTG